MAQHPTSPVELMNPETKYVYLAVQGLTDEVTQLRGEIRDDAEMMQSSIRSAVAEGIRDVLKDEQTLEAMWASAFGQLQIQARAKTGEFILGGLWAVLTKAVMFLALGYLVYLFGGWTALSALWKALFGAHTP